MYEYLSSLVLASAIATLAAFLIPSENEMNKKAVEFGLALLLLLAVLRPISSLSLLEFKPENIFKGADAILSGELLFSPETENEAREAVARGIEKDLAAKFHIPQDAIRATPTLTLTAGELKMPHLLLHISLAGQSADLIALKNYASETYQTECEVKTDVP